MKLVSIGFGNLVSAGRIISIVSPESAPIKRMIQEVRERPTDRCVVRTQHQVRDRHGQRECNFIGAAAGDRRGAL